MVADFIADHPQIVLPIAAFVSAFFGVGLFVVAWRARRHPLKPAVAGLAGVVLVGVSGQLLGQFGMNRSIYALQSKTGFGVASYRLWTVDNDVEHQLGQFQGKPVLLYLWATWCGPCRPTLPVLAELSAEFEGRAVIVALSHEERDALAEFAERSGIPGIAAYAPAPMIPPGRTWAFPQAPVPTTFLIDKSSVVRKVMVGPRSAEHLRALLGEMVAET